MREPKLLSPRDLHSFLMNFCLQTASGLCVQMIAATSSFTTSFEKTFLLYQTDSSRTFLIKSKLIKVAKTVIKFLLK